MSRFVALNVKRLEAEALKSAQETLRSHGAVVVKAIGGVMLFEIAPAKLPAVKRTLPGWTITPERKSVTVPERTSLERLKARAAQTVRAK